MACFTPGERRRFPRSRASDRGATARSAARCSPPVWRATSTRKDMTTSSGRPGAWSTRRAGLPAGGDQPGLRHDRAVRAVRLEGDQLARRRRAPAPGAPPGPPRGCGPPPRPRRPPTRKALEETAATRPTRRTTLRHTARFATSVPCRDVGNIGRLGARRARRGVCFSWTRSENPSILCSPPRVAAHPVGRLPTHARTTLHPAPPPSPRPCSLSSDARQLRAATGWKHGGVSA